MADAAVFVFWIAVIGLLAYAVYVAELPNAVETPPVVNIYDSDVQIVPASDRQSAPDVTTITTEVPTQQGPIAVARVQTMPGECTGVCTTACPTTVVSGLCPVGTICCK
jgi:hypothetical protein